HEIAEAATDPNVNYRAVGWYDDYKNCEIGDINRYEVMLNGYAVQSLINKYDVAYIPSGGTTLRALDAIGLSGLASSSAHPTAADARLRLSPDGGNGPAGQTGQACKIDTPFALPASSHGQAPSLTENPAWFSLLVGSCPDSKIAI